MGESKASINFKPVKSNSEHHNLRRAKLDYVHEDLLWKNEVWRTDEINPRLSSIRQLYKEKVGQNMQKKATPIREAVVNIKSDTTIDDLKALADDLRREKGIDCFQIHVHRDEGKSIDDINYHAHMVFDWQNKATGKSFKLNRQDISEIQDIVAERLKMERGERKENTNRQRLEAVEYKAHQEEQKMKILQEENALLEQKKNELESEYKRLKREDIRLKGQHPKHPEYYKFVAENPDSRNVKHLSERQFRKAVEYSSTCYQRASELRDAIQQQQAQIRRFEQGISSQEQDIQEFENEIREIEDKV